MSMERTRTLLALMVSAVLSMSTAVESAEWGVIIPSDIKWIDLPSYPGVKFAVLSGTPGKPGPYTLRAKFPPNYQLGPHTPTDDRVLTILEGAWKQGVGDDFDPGKAVHLPRGSFATIPANQIHFDIAGPEGATVQVTGTGGDSRTAYVNPADDPKNKYKQ